MIPYSVRPDLVDVSIDLQLSDSFLCFLPFLMQLCSVIRLWLHIQISNVFTKKFCRQVIFYFRISIISRSTSYNFHCLIRGVI